MQFILLLPGPSMSQALADSVSGHRVGAVNNCYELAPWAEFIAATDKRWWQFNQDAHQFAGMKFSANEIDGVGKIRAKHVTTGSCSGVLGLEVAKILGARRIILLGADLQGSHFFGPYTNGLANTTDDRRELHKKQFAAWGAHNSHIDVINCTPGSALEAFPHGKLSDII